MKPVLSVVIPCLNEVRYIEGCVGSLLSNGFSPDRMEILVVDGGSTDGTISVLERLSLQFPQVKVLNNPLRITPRSLNMGVMAAQGEFTLISSAHAAFSSGYIQTLMDIMNEKPDALGVGGMMHTEVKNSTPVSESIRTVLMHPIGVGNAKFRTGVKALVAVDTVPFGLYRSSLLKATGGYDERLIRNHDMELSKRLCRQGGSIYLSPNATCTYFAREDYMAMAKNNYNNGKWNLKTVWLTKTFSSLSLRHFIPLLFLMSWTIPMGLALLFGRPYWTLPSLAIITVYALVLLAVSWRARNGKNRVLQTLIAFILLHLFYGLGSFMGLLSIPFMSREK